MATSMFELFRATATARPEAVAARHALLGEWRDVTWRELARAADCGVGAFVARGIAPGDRVAILSNTRLEWTIADLAIMGAGAVTVPIYHSSLAPEVEHILSDAGVVAIVVEDAAQLAKVDTVRARLPALRTVVAIEPVPPVEGSPVVGWDDFLGQGEAQREAHAGEIAARQRAVGRETLLTIIYTSGTTGLSKGVMLTHDNILYAAEEARALDVVRPDDVAYLFLPLAHVFAKVLEAAWFSTGHVQALWRRDQKRIVDDIGEIRPTFFAAVPRVFEKIYARVAEDAARTAGLRGRLGRWALAKAHEVAHRPDAGASDLAWLVARRLVFGAIGERLKARLGGRLRFAISGGAPLPREVAVFFQAAGIDVCEGYGLTESAGASTVNRPGQVKPGTVGQPLPGTEIRIAPDGEVLLRGRGIMRGYWNREAETREVLDADGWLHTGDIGQVDADGYITITDRKKDLIVTAGGKNVAPQKIENRLKTMNPLIGQVVVHGDRRQYLTALVTLDADALRAWAGTRGLGDASHAALATHPEVEAEIRRAVEALNAELPSWETIKRFTVLDHEFEVGEQLTPTMKVKRKVCSQRYAAELERMYP